MRVALTVRLKSALKWWCDGLCGCFRTNTHSTTRPHQSMFTDPDLESKIVPFTSSYDDPEKPRNSETPRDGDAEVCNEYNHHPTGNDSLRFYGDHEKRQKNVDPLRCPTCGNNLSIISIHVPMNRSDGRLPSSWTWKKRREPPSWGQDREVFYGVCFTPGCRSCRNAVCRVEFGEATTSWLPLSAEDEGILATGELSVRLAGNFPV